MALQVYTLVTVLVDGALLTEESQVSVDRDSRAQEVATTAKGFAGFSRRAHHAHRGRQRGPELGLRTQPRQVLHHAGRPHPVRDHSLRRVAHAHVEGVRHQDTLRHGVNAEARISFSFVGEPADWQ